jgi:hypothetical protein
VKRPLRLAATLVGVGFMFGSAIGFIVSRSSACVLDATGPVPEGACVRLFGMYFSSTAKYVLGGALVGVGIGLAFALFIITPVVLWRTTERTMRMHPFEVPIIWFGLQLVELFVLIPALLFWVPDPGAWPEAARWAIWIVAIIGVTAANYALRRRFIPR